MVNEILVWLTIRAILDFVKNSIILKTFGRRSGRGLWGHWTDQLLGGWGLGVAELSAAPGLCSGCRPWGPAPEDLAEQGWDWSPGWFRQPWCERVLCFQGASQSRAEIHLKRGHLRLLPDATDPVVCCSCSSYTLVWISQGGEEGGIFIPQQLASPTNQETKAFLCFFFSPPRVCLLAHHCDFFFAGWPWERISPKRTPSLCLPIWEERITFPASQTWCGIKESASMRRHLV